MKHATAAVLLLTIIATPVTAAVCVYLCSAATETSMACQHHLAIHSVQNARANCEGLVAASLYLKVEPERLSPAVALAGTTPPFFAHAAGEAPLVSTAAGGPALSDRATSSVVLRL